MYLFLVRESNLEWKIKYKKFVWFRFFSLFIFLDRQNLLQLANNSGQTQRAGQTACSSPRHNDVSPTDSKGREINTSKMVFRWAVVRQARRQWQHPLALQPCPLPRAQRPRTALHRLSARCSYTNRSSFQKTTSTIERGMDLLSWGIWGSRSDLGFSYKAKHRSLSTQKAAAL